MANGGQTLYLPGEQLTAVTSGSTTTVTGARIIALPSGGDVVRTGATTSYSFEIPDQQGTNELSLDNTAQIPTWRQFTPYGASRGTAVTWIDNRGFLNKPADPGTGLDYIGARAYNPQTAQFISPDPVLNTADPQDLDPYDYAEDNPVTNSDPTGQRPTGPNNNMLTLGELCADSPQECAPPQPTGSPLDAVAGALNSLYGLAKGLLPVAEATTPGIGLLGPVINSRLPADIGFGNPDSVAYQLGSAAADIGSLLAPETDAADVSANILGRAAAEDTVALDSGTARALSSADRSVANRLISQIGGRQMIMPQTAADEFQSAAARLAGPLEKGYVEDLMNQVQIVADNPSARAAALRVTGRVGANDIQIFGTADSMGIPIFTSDMSFLRGAAAPGC